jgi:hypothetical protein
LGKIDIGTLKQITTEERMIKFHIQEYERCGKVIMPICSKLQGRQIDQTFGIMDVKGEQQRWPTASLRFTPGGCVCSRDARTREQIEMRLQLVEQHRLGRVLT